MDKAEVIEKVKKYNLLLNDHFEVDSVFLFGSYANDTFKGDSDIDVAIVVKKIKGEYFSTIPVLWKLRREIDDRIEPILLEKDNDVSGFLCEIQRTGVRVV